MPTHFLAETITDSTTTSVSTLTVLKNWTDLGGTHNQLLFWLSNTDATNYVDLFIETSEDGVRPDIHVETVRVPAGKQGSKEIGPFQLRRYWRVSAQTVSPVFPTAVVKWGIRGVSRR
jgi:hypothetical protein